MSYIKNTLKLSNAQVKKLNNAIQSLSPLSFSSYTSGENEIPVFLTPYQHANFGKYPIKFSKKQLKELSKDGGFIAAIGPLLAKLATMGSTALAAAKTIGTAALPVLKAAAVPVAISAISGATYAGAKRGTEKVIDAIEKKNTASVDGGKLYLGREKTGGNLATGGKLFLGKQGGKLFLGKQGGNIKASFNHKTNEIIIHINNITISIKISDNIENDIKALKIGGILPIPLIAGLLGSLAMPLLSKLGSGIEDNIKILNNHYNCNCEEILKTLYTLIMQCKNKREANQIINKINKEINSKIGSGLLGKLFGLPEGKIPILGDIPLLGNLF